MNPNQRRTVAMGVASSLLLLSGCASVSGTARPAAFPGARVSIPAPSLPRPTAIVSEALTLLGSPYRLGGDTPERGFDCSGLVHYVFQREQIALPRTVLEQFRTGNRVVSDDIKPGDLIFFAIDGGREPTHVGIAIDEEHFVHAPGSGRQVRVERFRTPYWESRLAGVRRIRGTT